MQNKVKNEPCIHIKEHEIPQVKEAIKIIIKLN